MPLSEHLIKKISSKYEPATMVYLTFRGNDIALKTDSEGNPIQLFIGEMQEDGHIRGERYIRNIIKDKDGIIIKDHWDKKGKST
jgi:hypothetical protein